MQSYPIRSPMAPNKIKPTLPQVYVVKEKSVGLKIKITNRTGNPKNPL